jgi:shikimate kinase
MEAESDVVILIVNQAQKAKQINVSHMEAEKDVMNRIVNQAQ